MNDGHCAPARTREIESDLASMKLHLFNESDKSRENETNRGRGGEPAHSDSLALVMIVVCS